MNALLLAMVWGVVAAIGFAALSKFERSISKQPYLATY